MMQDILLAQKQKQHTVRCSTTASRDVHAVKKMKT